MSYLGIFDISTNHWCSPPTDVMFISSFFLCLHIIHYTFIVSVVEYAKHHLDCRTVHLRLPEEDLDVLVHELKFMCSNEV